MELPGPAVATAILLSFLLGCLSAWLGDRAFRTFMIFTVFQAILVSLIFLSVFWLCLYGVSLLGRLVGTYRSSETDPLLIAFIVGLGVVMLLQQLLYRRRQR
jgi:hypothetical protein